MGAGTLSQSWAIFYFQFFFFDVGDFFFKSLLNLLQYCFCFMLCFVLAMSHVGS